MLNVLVGFIEELKAGDSIAALRDSLKPEAIVKRENKIKRFQKFLINKKIDYYFLSSLDSIAWILNLRGNDIQYTPIFLSNLLIPAKGKLTLFTFHNNIEKKAREQLKSTCNLESIYNFEKSIKIIVEGGTLVRKDADDTPINQKPKRKSRTGLPGTGRQKKPGSDAEK